MTVAEEPLVIPCCGSHLVGILHRSARPAFRGVVVVVGGPQYRVGSHRQFVLLARALAEAGIPVLRFDYRGMGDSSGHSQHFEAIGADIRVAVDVLFDSIPALKEAVLWGLCDAASAICLYAPTDSRVTGVVLVNPWVRTSQGQARTYLRHYYLKRFVQPDFWRRIVQGGFSIGTSLASLYANLRRALGNGFDSSALAGGAAESPLGERMVAGLERFPGRILMIFSENDLTAAEFKDTAKASARWRQVLGSSRSTRLDLPDADHTFSRKVWRDQVAHWCLDWLGSY